ncbi:DUF6480 family protein [Rhodococcus sp. IEGM 1414]
MRREPDPAPRPSSGGAPGCAVPIGRTGPAVSSTIRRRCQC